MVTSRFPPFVLILKHLNGFYILQCIFAKLVEEIKSLFEQNIPIGPL